VGRLHAGRTAGVAVAAVDQVAGSRHQRFEAVVAAAGQPHPAGVAVVDENRAQPRVGVVGRREAADVPAVAQELQREQRDERVLGGVDPAREVAVGPQVAFQRLRDREVQALRLQTRLREVERFAAQPLARPGVASLEPRDPLAHRHVGEPEGRPARERPLLAVDLDRDRLLVADLRVVVDPGGVEFRPLPVEIQVHDLVRSALVVVDCPGVGVTEGVRQR